VIIKPDPKLDLVLERVIDVPREIVWECWTKAEHIPHWFVPRPWKVVECELDLRPGGKFFTVFQSPDGQKFPNHGCYLEVTPHERLIWTDTLHEGYRPSGKGFLPEDMPLTAILTFTADGKGTRYNATCLHKSEEGRKKHEAMGFFEGWGTCIDQLVEYSKTMKRG